MLIHRNRTTRFFLAALAGSLSALASGCGDDSGLSTRYPVSGKVTYKKEPVKNAVINFVPVAGGGRGATGHVVDGLYTLTTQDPDDGAFPGKYKVTVDDRQIDDSILKKKTAELAVKTKIKQGGMIPQEFQASALKQAKGILPGKYQIASTSTVEVEVKAQTNKIDIDLPD